MADEPSERVKFNKLEARLITLVDEHDKARIQLDGNDGALTVLDETEEVRFQLTIEQKSPNLILWDADSVPRLSIRIDEEKRIHLNLLDQSGSETVALTAAKDFGLVALYCTREDPMVILTATELGSMLKLKNTKGNMTWSAYAEDDAVGGGSAESAPDSE